MIALASNTIVTFDINQLSSLVINVSAVLAFLTGAYLALRKWVQRAALEAATASKVVQTQLKTSNGSTIGEYVEQSAHDLGQLVDQVKSMRSMIETTAQRLDHHITTHNDAS